MLKVDEEKCVGCGLCSSLCPEVFDFNTEGKAVINPKANLKKNKKCVKEAIETCPENAISE